MKKQNALRKTAACLLSLGLMTISTSVWATCRSSGDTAYTFRGTQALTDNGMNQPMSAWLTSNLAFPFYGCSGAMTLSLDLVATLPVVGTYDGRSVYATNVPGLGIQLATMVLFGNSTNPWERPPVYYDGHQTIRAAGNVGGPNTAYPGRAVTRKLVRYIKIGDVSVSNALSVNVKIGTDTTLPVGASTGSTVSSDTYINAVLQTPPPVCSVQVTGGNTVNLGAVSPRVFANIGDASPAKPFSWRSVCSSGTPRTVYVTYAATNPVTDAAQGRMAVTGGAQGIELQVFRGVAGGSAGTPVAFGTTYTLGSTATNPGEDMSVRYVRTGTVGVGRAQGGMQVNLSYP